MNHRHSTGWVCLAAAILPLSAATARTLNPATTPLTLVERFEAARLDFDPAALAATLAPEFVEISPRGEVDKRDAVLGFYAPANRNTAPPIESDEVSVRPVGHTALVSKRLTVILPGAGGRRSVRALYVAHRGTDGWRLVSAQYTPIPPSLAK